VNFLYGIFSSFRNFIFDVNTLESSGLLCVQGLLFSFPWLFGPFPGHDLPCFLPPIIPMSCRFARVFLTEQFDGIFLHFVFPSNLSPSNGPSSSKPFFQNLFLGFFCRTLLHTQPKLIFV